MLPKKEQLTFRLDPEVLHLRDSYCEFISSTQNNVLEQALLVVFHRDRDFQTWLETKATTRKERKADRAVGVADDESSTSGM
jgi:hypothetical protein